MTFPGSSSSFRSTASDKDQTQTHTSLPPVLIFRMFRACLNFGSRVSTQQIYAPKHLFLPPCSLLRNNDQMLHAVSHLKRCGKVSFTGCQPVIYRMPQSSLHLFIDLFLVLHSNHSVNKLRFTLRHLLRLVLAGSLERGGIWMRLIFQF